MREKDVVTEGERRPSQKQRERSTGTGREGGERRTRGRREGHRVGAEGTDKQAENDGKG